MVCIKFCVNLAGILSMKGHGGGEGGEGEGEGGEGEGEGEGGGAEGGGGGGCLGFELVPMLAHRT
jgi:hypothetical protein